MSKEYESNSYAAPVINGRLVVSKVTVPNRDAAFLAKFKDSPHALPEECEELVSALVWATEADTPLKTIVRFQKILRTAYDAGVKAGSK